MYLKIMGAGPLSDADPRKTFQLYSGLQSARFHRRPDGSAFVEAFFGDMDLVEFEAPGNVYIMNADGKTIGTFGAADAGLDLRSADDA